MDYSIINATGAKLNMVAVHFSTVCAAKCSWCYVAETLLTRQRPAPYDLVERTIRRLAEEGVKEILFVGGDPVLHPDFRRSIALAKEVGLIVSVLSNSWSLRPSEDFKSQISYIDNCEATVLGHTATLHDSITRQRKSYDILVSNLKKIARAGKSIGACLNAMPQTLPHLYETAKALAEDHGIPIRSVMIQRVIPSGGSAGDFKFGLNLSDMTQLMEQVDRIHRDFRVPIFFEDPVPFCTVDEKYHHLLSRCEWGYTRGSVNSKGELNRCGADDHYRLGSIFDGSLQEKWRCHPVLVSFRSKKYLAEECLTCPLLERCGGGCPLSCGTCKDHDLDFLYLQRRKAEATGQYAPGFLAGDAVPAPRIRNVYPQDWESISALERKLFPGVKGLFTPESLGRCLRRFPAGVLVAEQAGLVVGYLGVFPLTSAGTETVERDNVATVCDLREEHIGTSLGNGCPAVFVEVIAFDPECSSVLRRQLWRELLARIDGYRGRLFSCPVSGPGEDLIRRHGFRPFQEGQAYTVYMRDGYARHSSR